MLSLLSQADPYAKFITILFLNSIPTMILLLAISAKIMRKIENAPIDRHRKGTHKKVQNKHNTKVVA